MRVQSPIERVLYSHMGLSLKQARFRRELKRVVADPVRREVSRLCNRGRIPVGYCDIPNWGDALNPVLVELLSGHKTQHLEASFYDRYLVIGSVLAAANSRAKIWGSGFIEEDATILEPPSAIHAVRGPLTRAAFQKAGIECPTVYGDPALLLPRFYNPPVSKRYEIGVVPHYIDKSHPWVEQNKDNPSVLMIDVESGIGSFVRAVKSCKVILSSSLHGLICADAYGVPNVWIKLSEMVIGGDFKFRDYRLSIGASDPVPIDVRSVPSLARVVSQAEVHELRIDLRKLLLACPFLHPLVRNHVISMVPAPGTGGLPENIPSGLSDPAELVKLCS